MPESETEMWRDRTLLRTSCTRQVRLQVLRFIGLDSKAGILVGFVAAALAEIVGALIIVSAEHPAWFSILGFWAVLATFAPSILAIMAVVGCAWHALRPHHISMGTNFKEYVEQFKSASDPKAQVRKFAAGYAAEVALMEAWIENEASLEVKAKWVGRCAFCAGSAVVLLSLTAVAIIRETILYTPVSQSASETRRESPSTIDAGRSESTESTVQQKALSAETGMARDSVLAQKSPKTSKSGTMKGGSFVELGSLCDFLAVIE